MNDYIVMLRDLIQCIKVKFPCNKIYVSGYSLGNIIAMEALYLIQDDVEAFLAIGQVTSISDSKKNLIQQLEDVELSSRKRRIVDMCEKYDDMEHYLELERVAIFQTKSMLFRKKGITYRKTSLCAFRILFSPDYNILDVWHCFSQCFKTKRMKKLLDTLYEIDTKEKIKNIRCPLYLLQGETDPYSD
jgi:pimeloyl-ACP methyl ester carboxylesterase